MPTADFWKKYFETYDILNTAIPYQELLNEICNELEIKPGEKILEAGSGTGNLAIEIKKRGAGVVALDIEEEGLKIHKLKDPEANVILADLTKKLPFPDNYFDKICSNNTIYFIHPQKRMSIMNELFRILKPNGKIVIVNIIKGFKPIKIYIEHTKKTMKKTGIFATIINVIKMIPSTIKMFYYSYLIQKANKGNDNLEFFDFEEQKRLLKQSKFINISNTKIVFANQSILNSGYKPR